mmetsp:Transcript_18421/g.38568  ORF Transcript_18421/g.38568 Transcript_18421/m.38568 type:complete len:281 (-) Transcript_18421:2442-3284(-)
MPSKNRKRSFRTENPEEAPSRDPPSIGQNVGKSLYDILDVPREASPREIKTAYRRLALQLHPDRNSAENANEAFRQLQRVYEILTDEEKRRIYDETGAVPDEEVDASIGGKSAAELYQLFRQWYPAVDATFIRDYEKQYRYGNDEKEDLAEFYQRYQGKVVQVIQFIPYSDDTDVQRFVAYWDEAIDCGELPVTKAYPSTRRRLLRRVKGIKPRTRASADDGAQGQAALAQLILAKRSNREDAFRSFTDHLAAKYGGIEGSQEDGRKKRKKAKQNSTTEK